MDEEGETSQAVVTAAAAPGEADDDEVMIDADETALPPDTGAPIFPELPASAQRTTLKSEIRRVPVPPHRMTPLKKDWVNIFGPLTEMLGLQVRMNVPRRCVEIRVRSPHVVLWICSDFNTDVQTYQGSWSVAEGSRFREGVRTWLRSFSQSTPSLFLLIRPRSISTSKSSTFLRCRFYGQ